MLAEMFRWRPQEFLSGIRPTIRLVKTEGQPDSVRQGASR